MSQHTNSVANLNPMHHRSIWTILAILTPLVLSISLSMDIYVPSLPMIVEKFHTSQQALQWTLSIYMFGVGFGQLCFGPLTDYFGRRKIVLIGIFIYLLGTLACIFSGSITILILGRLLQSIGTCAALVVAYAVVRDLYDVTTSARIYSFLNAATALGPVVAPLLGGYLQIHYHTWRASFVFLLIFAGLSLFSTFFFLKETLHHSKRLSINPRELIQRYKSILKSKVFIESTFHASVGMTVLFVFCCISSYLLITNLHVSELQYGLAFGSNAVAFIIASLVSARLSSRFNLRLPIRLGGIVLLIGSIIMLFINLFFGLSIFHFMIPMWFASFGAGLMMGPAVAIALEKFPHAAGTASSIINASEFIFAGLFGTILMMHSASTLIPFASLMLVLGLISITWSCNSR